MPAPSHRTEQPGAAALEPLLSLLTARPDGTSCREVLLGPDPVAIGRDPEADLHLPEPLVSRFHAVIDRVEPDWLLRDLSSTNGTLLNGLRLSPDQGFALRAGDLIEIGPHRVFVAARRAALPGVILPGGPEYDLPDLVRDGVERLASGLVELEAEVLSCFAGPQAEALDRALDLVARRLQVHGATLLRSDLAGGSRPVGARTRGRRSAEELGELPLATIASQACSTRRGILFHGHRPRPGVFHETATEGQWSAAAVPVRLDLALVVERAGKPRLDRRDLAELALLAERLGSGLSELA